MNNFEPVRWRWSHYKHHGHTAYAEPLDFEIVIRKPTDLIFFFSLFVPFGGVLFFHKSLQMETIKHAMGITTAVMEHSIPEKRTVQVHKLSPYPCGNLDHRHRLLDAIPVLVAGALPHSS